MEKKLVSITRYETPIVSVKQAVTSCGGLDLMPSNARVFIKPNIVFWTKTCAFPKWGVITTSRVIEDMVILLKEYDIEDITIGEGIVADPKDRETPADAFKTLGYETLGRRYGVKFINVMERPFKKVNLGDGISLKFNEDILESDFLVNIPAMKCHNQTVVSLGIKNLKGTIDISSRKKCHSPDPEKDLHFHVSRLADKMPPMLTLIDGIYTLERGPGFDGRMKRSNLLIASADILSADMVGAKVLGHEPADVPHLSWAAKKRNRPLDLSDVEVVGERIEDVASFHEHDFEYSSNESGEMPLPLAKQGITGLFYRKFDDTMCTYCSGLNGLILSAIRGAWRGEPWDNIEVLTGKTMKPASGMNATVLVGQCMYKANKDHPDVKKMLAVKGCPPLPKEVVSVLHEAGIEVEPALFSQIDALPGFFMARYQDKPEFDESFFRVE
ncbi:MAG: DUF362 domain-containing protein [Dethiobacter sp.]|jgi:uncharacterized protein (DUF362 family)|nr:DUF362 domain-containing protein [Dethiobacter sp.]